MAGCCMLANKLIMLGQKIDFNKKNYCCALITFQWKLQRF